MAEDATEMKTLTAECVFCGSTRELTREHVWPRWMQALVQKTLKGHLPVIRHRLVSTVEGADRAWKRAIFTLRTDAVICKVCNGGWMSELEMDAKPILSEMCLGRSVELHESAQATLARWFMKSAMVLQLAVPHDIIRPHQYRYLCTNRRPPPTCQVWLGYRRVADGGLATSCFRALPVGTSEDAIEGHPFLVSFAVGYLVGQVFGHDLAVESRWDRRGSFAPCLQSVWPYDEPVCWPPASTLDFIGLAEDPGFDAELRRLINAHPSRFPPVAAAHPTKPT